jgi:glucokinase
MIFSHSWPELTIFIPALTKSAVFPRMKSRDMAKKSKEKKPQTKATARSPRLALALDYGGTKLSAAVAEAGSREWLARGRVYSPPDADGRYDRATMLKLAHGLLKKTRGTLGAVGVSFGGAVNAERGLVLLSHHVPGWENIDLRGLLEAEFGVPAAIENDAHAAALGEYKFGAGRNCKSLLYVTVSTGVGGGWVLDGKIFQGRDGLAGQIGHIVVRPGGAECVCGKRGCVEAEACGPGIARKMKEWLKDSASEKITGEWVAEAARRGDPRARVVMDDAATMLGAGVGAAINLMNPERVALGGGVTKSGKRWWRIVRETARLNALPEIRVDIRPTQLGDDAPLWGAVAVTSELGICELRTPNPVLS